MRNYWISLALLFVLALTGCGGAQAGRQDQGQTMPPQETLSTPSANPQPNPTEQSADLSPTPTKIEVQVSDNEGSSSAPRSIVEKAKADLSKQVGVNTDQIRVRETRAVDWPDASLGCPQSDMAYVQVITPGYWILLEAEGKQYPYHTDQNEQIILCMGDPSNPQAPPLIPVNPNEIDDGQPWVPVN